MSTTFVKSGDNQLIFRYGNPAKPVSVPHGHINAQTHIDADTQFFSLCSLARKRFKTDKKIIMTGESNRHRK